MPARRGILFSYTERLMDEFPLSGYPRPECHLVPIVLTSPHHVPAVLVLMLETCQNQVSVTEGLHSTQNKII